MPRTKAPTKKKNNKEKDNEAELIICADRIPKELLKMVHQRSAAREKCLALLLEKFELKFRVNLTAIPVSTLGKTMEEFELQKNAVMQSICDNFSTDSIQCLSQSVKTKKGRTNKRSRSYAEDDGYLTAESNDSKLSGKRTSRSRTTTKNIQQKEKRTSRSLSRTNLMPRVSTAKSYKTPANSNKQPNTLGMVTPKMKANTPQVMLRRPKQGEIAISLQGSPLMVNGVVSDQMANVNIPLQDGRLLSLQPQRGLRISQIPAFDLDTQKQLLALRDNLNKVCEFTANRT